LDEGNQAWVVLTFYDAGETELNDHSLALTATTGYQPFTVLAIAPPETAMVRAWLWKDAGEAYHFSGWTWLDGSDDAWAGLTFYDAAWQPLAEQSQVLTASLSYQPFTIQAEAPAGTTYAGAWLWKNEGEGYLYADDLSLVLARAGEMVSATVIHYDYDRLYRLTEAVYSGDIEAGYSYVYDSVGNMTAYTETIGTETSSASRTFNAANQLLVSLDNEAGTTSFYYDNNGNLVQILPPGVNPGEAGEQVYSFNQRNLLTEYRVGAGSSVYDTVAEYVYDGDGHRLQQIDHSGSTPITTTYTNDNSGLSQVLVSDDGATQTYNLFGLSLIQQDNGSEIRTLLNDGLGSVRQEMVDAAIESTTTYEPFGNLLVQTGLSGTTYGFTGEQHDAATGLVYLRARYYNPSLKLFMSRDPFPGWTTQPATQHPYTYVGNNAVNRTDPSGNCFFFGIDTLICLGAGVGFLTGIGIQTYQNSQAGMPFLEAIYHENIDWTPVAASTTAGGLAGALAPFIPAGTTFGGAVAYGALDGLITGLIDQTILNLFMPCREWHEDLLTTGASSTLAGALTVGLFSASGKTVSGVIRSLEGKRFVPGSLFAKSNISTSKFSAGDLDDLRVFAERVQKVNSERGFESFGATWSVLGEMGSQNLYIARSGNDVAGAMLLGGSPSHYRNATALEVKFLEGTGGGSGTALLQTAHQVSKERGFEGAIMLASSDQAISFYKQFPGYTFDPGRQIFYWSPEAARIAFGK
jgi:RHS repeat-associated protein